jgi:hypothetical protein
MKCSISYIASAVFLAGLVPALVAQPAPRRPPGIYALVNIKENISSQQKANPSITPAELEDYFIKLCHDLLNNPAVSGLVIGDGTELPLPWNPLYKTSWKTLLTALAARYGSNPAPPGRLGSSIHLMDERFGPTGRRLPHGNHRFGQVETRDPGVGYRDTP